MCGQVKLADFGYCVQLTEEQKKRNSLVAPQHPGAGRGGFYLGVGGGLEHVRRRRRGKGRAEAAAAAAAAAVVVWGGLSRA